MSSLGAVSSPTLVPQQIALVSPAFQSPEIAGEEDLKFLDWYQLEVWLLGILCFFTAVGRYPFSMEDGMIGLLDHIVNVHYDDALVADPVLRSLIRSQLARVGDRANLQQCSAHAFFSEYAGETPADVASWHVAAAPAVSFVDGVDAKGEELSPVVASCNVGHSVHDAEKEKGQQSDQVIRGPKRLETGMGGKRGPSSVSRQSKYSSASSSMAVGNDNNSSSSVVASEAAKQEQLEEAFSRSSSAVRRTSKGCTIL